MWSSKSLIQSKAILNCKRFVCVHGWCCFILVKSSVTYPGNSAAVCACKCIKSDHKKVTVRKLSSVALMSWPICMAWPDLAWPCAPCKKHTHTTGRITFYILQWIRIWIISAIIYLFWHAAYVLSNWSTARVAEPSNETYIRYRNYCHHHVVKCAHKHLCNVCVRVWCSCTARSCVKRIIIYTFTQTHMLLANIKILAVKSNRIYVHPRFSMPTIFECK